MLSIRNIRQLGQTFGKWASGLAICGLALAIASAMPMPGRAATSPKQIGTFGGWSAYSLTDEKAKTKTCYVVARPASTEPKGAKRAEASVLVTHRQGDASNIEINVNAGYNYKKDSKVELAVGKEKFQLTTFDKPGYKDSAFAPEGKDAAVVAAMEKAPKMTVKGVSDHGNETTDTYSLSGLSAALKAIRGACK
jgi:hypothetical protein